MVEAARRRKPREQVGATNSAIYSSKIIKAGALLPDTKTLLTNWNIAVPVRVNLDRLRRENIFGKSSRSRVEDVLTIFRQRFLLEESVTKALVVLAQKLCGYLRPGIGGRSGGTTGRCDRRSKYRCGIGRKGDEHHNSDCVCDIRRSSGGGTCCEPQPTGR
jgi:Putative inner membrane protein (DUF1819)